MSGALVNLVAKGVQDQALTGDAEVSYFRSVWKRHSNFVHHIVELQGIGHLAQNSIMNYAVPRKGDMLSYVFVDTGSSDVATSFSPDDPSSASMFRMSVGGQEIEQCDAFFATRLFNKFLLNTNSRSRASQSGAAFDPMNPLAGVDTGRFFPIPFNVSQDFSSALPLVAIPYHDVEIKIHFNGGTPASDMKVYACYIHLDSQERKMLAEKPQDMLITQTQRITAEPTGNFDLSLLNHPCKCLLWAPADSATVTFDAANVQLNGNDISEPMPPLCYTAVQSYFHTDTASDLHSGNHATSYMYSFALKANNRNPQGTCNMSRLDNAFLRFHGLSATKFTHLYAVNYNILKVSGGLAGIAWSS